PQRAGQYAALAREGHRALDQFRVALELGLLELDRSNQADRARLADERMLGERVHLGREHGLEAAYALHEPLALEYVEVRERSGAGGRMARVRIAVPERDSIAAPKRLLHARPEDDAAERHVGRRGGRWGVSPVRGE